jgi:hypothetical protein
MPQMKSCGKPDNGPPRLKSVEPARQQPGGSDRRHRLGQTRTENNPHQRGPRQVRGLVVIANVLSTSAWNRLRSTLILKEAKPWPR